MDTRKKFQVNEYIELALEEDSTVIYVAGESFLQCKYLLLQFESKNAEDYESIDSIDEIADLLDNSMERGFQRSEIPPETEFWGHCSNIQAWAENNYDTRILHSNLAFPLLKRLTEVGDSVAKVVFQEEICKRFESLNPSTLLFLLQNHYIGFLTEEQKKDLLTIWMKKDFENALVLLISGKYIEEFGQQYSSMVTQNLRQHLDSREEAHFTREFPLFLEEFGLTGPLDFAVQLLSERDVLAEIFDKYPYTIPKEDHVGGVGQFPRYGLLKRLHRELYDLQIKDKQYRVVIIKRLKNLFDSNRSEIVAALLDKKFYELIPLPLFKSWISKENSPFMKGLFAFYGYEFYIKHYYAPYQVGYPFLFSYLDEEALHTIAWHLNNLHLPTRRSVFHGIFRGIGNRTFRKDILRIVEHIMDRIELKMTINPIQPTLYDVESLRETLQNPNEIIIRDPNVQLIIPYPRAENDIFTYSQKGGYTRMELFSLINKSFSTMYQEHLQQTGKDHIYTAHHKDVFIYRIYLDPITNDVWIFANT